MGSQLRGVIFDLDGVIADTEPYHAQAYVEAFRSFSIHIGLDDYKKNVTIGGKKVTDYFVELGGNAQDVSKLYALKDSIVFPKMAGSLQPRPGVIQLLKSLRVQGVGCSIATSARSKNAHFVTELLGISDCFALIHGMEHVGKVKPDPELFALTLRRMGIKPNEAVIIEDSPKGLQAGLAAGVRTVITRTDWTRHCDFDGARMVVDSLEGVTSKDLAELLEWS